MVDKRMAHDRQNDDLQAALERARRRWLLAAMINAGGRWAVLPAASFAVLALAFALAFKPGLVWLLFLCACALAGVGLSLILALRAHAAVRRAGAPDWSISLDRELGLADSLITLLDGAGPFARLVQARVAAGFDEARARQAAPRRQYGPLAAALLLAILPLALWQPENTEPDLSQAQPGLAKADASNGRTSENPAAAKGVQPGEQKGPEKGSKGEKPGESESTSESGGGDVQKPKPGEKGNEGATPGEQPPPDTAPQPAKPDGSPPKSGDSSAQKPPTPPEVPERKVDAKDTPVTPDAGEGERRAEERRKYVYDENGDRAPGAKATGPTWKEKAEDVIPRMNLTSRERKLLEEWFRRIGTP